MGQSCSTCTGVHKGHEFNREDSPDPVMATADQKTKNTPPGQHHLMYKNQSKTTTTTPSAGVENILAAPASSSCPTRLVVRRQSMRNDGEGVHIYAVRYPEEVKHLFDTEQAMPTSSSSTQEQCPRRNTTMTSQISRKAALITGQMGEMFNPANILQTPSQSIVDWVTVSQEHNIHIADIGLSAERCDHLVRSTEQVCRGQYAAYTYAKQTLGCREYPILVEACFPPVHTTVHAIAQKFPDSKRLQLDDREPHIVKYDVSRKERQKLDMHTDKSEWTFLIALSNGCGVDYEGGGTYFECLDSTIHLQRGHALIFPGKLRHCGKKISGGLRFLLVGFLVDKSVPNTKAIPIQQQQQQKNIVSGSESDESEEGRNAHELIQSSTRH
eukprot:scaffold25830_cov162-Cylindrotheca_fusiformis.AAC.2